MIITICDKNESTRAMLYNTISDFIESSNKNLTIIPYQSAKSLFFDIETDLECNLIFMDVDKNFADVETLRKIGYSGKVVITSTTAEYALEGYESGVSGYLLKPYNKEKVAKTLRRTIDNDDDDWYAIHSNRQIVTVRSKDIMFIESDNAKCYFHLNSGEILYEYNKLDVIESAFSDFRFVRSHKSFLVNMDYIERIGDNFVIKDGSIALIKSRNARQIKSIYLDYISKK